MLSIHPTRVAIGLATIAAVTTTASADFTGTSLVSMGEIIPGTITYRVFMEFSSPEDSVLAISSTVQPYRYSGSALVQNAPGFETLDLQDTPFVASLPGDSWVTIGGDVDSGVTDTQFSPGFLNPAFPGASVINGTFFEQPENGGYFDSNPGTPENGGSVLISQFTIAADGFFTYQGSVDWQGAGAGFQSNAWEIVPAPGAIALFGVVGFAAGRRRRG